jgi:hypothetical protein
MHVEDTECGDRPVAHKSNRHNDLATLPGRQDSVSFPNAVTRAVSVHPSKMLLLEV